MFSSLTSYFWGGAEGEEGGPAGPAGPHQPQQLIVKAPAPAAAPNAAAPNAAPRAAVQKQSSDEDDWVMVGGVRGSTLGSLNEINPRPSTGSTGSSSSPSEAGDAPPAAAAEAAAANPPRGGGGERPVQLTRSQKRLLTPFSGCQANASLPQRKAARAAQVQMVKRASKMCTAKATERHNKAVKNQAMGSLSKKQGASRHNMAIKASGAFSKGLKQC